VAPFATGVSTNKYHMLPPCGTNPAWRQALLGRPAIAGCAPMLPRCGTSVVRHPPSAFAPFVLFRGNSPLICVHLRPSVVKFQFSAFSPKAPEVAPMWPHSGPIVLRRKQHIMKHLRTPVEDQWPLLLQV
jgi:hypothetical protein